MSYNPDKYNRFITFETPTDVNTKGSITRTWATVFTGYAKKIEKSGNSEEEAGKRTTVSGSDWEFPYNEGLVKDGRFSEGNATSSYYYVTNIMETEYQREHTVQTELRA